MEKVYLSLGSNLGDRLEYLSKAVVMLTEIEGVRICSISGVYETEPVGYADQPLFYNIVMEIETTIDANSLLIHCKNIENKIGRTFHGKWREREIDLDILFYGNQIIETGNLVIPHKELYNRKFVLKPMMEIAPDFRCPRTHSNITELFKACNDKSKIKKLFKFTPGVA